MADTAIECAHEAGMNTTIECAYEADMNTVNSTALNQLGEDNFTYHPTSLAWPIGAAVALAAALVVSFSALAFISGIRRKGGAGGERRCTDRGGGTHGRGRPREDV